MSKHIHKLSIVDLEAKTAICAKCGPTAIKVSGKNRRCLTAVAEEKRKDEYKTYQRQYQKANPRKRNTWAEIKRPHGLTTKEAKELRDNQSCWICGEVAPDKLCVDHCHDTNIIRGVLCSAHNLALGLFKDNPEHLMKAVEYLKGAPWI